MTKQAHSIIISVYAYEDEKQIAEALAELLPEKFEEEKILIQAEPIKILEGRNMTIFSVTLTKQRHIKQTLEQLKQYLGTTACQLIATQENRVDEEGNGYVRIEKKTFVQDGKAILTDSGDCFHMKIVLAAYPKKREQAIRVMKELFS